MTYIAPYAPHSATSKAAAKAIESRISPQQEKILHYLQECRKIGATDEQISDATGLSGDSVRPRQGELRDQLLIKKDGTRKTRSGRDADVWVIL
jgi:predicted transcriptional regulator